jgi:hypothetical protein
VLRQEKERKSRTIEKRARRNTNPKWNVSGRMRHMHQTLGRLSGQRREDILSLLLLLLLPLLLISILVLLLYYYHYYYYCCPKMI